MNVGEKFKQLRKALGLTQDKFSQSLGIPLSTLKGVESGKHVPSYNIFNKLASNPQLSQYVMWLVSDSDNTEPQVNENVTILDSRLKDVIVMVEEVLLETELSLTGSKKADLIYYLYEQYTNSDEEIEISNVIKLVKMAA